MARDDRLLPAPSDQPITARLAGAGSRRSELEAVLAAAPDGAMPEQMRLLVLASNVAGKGSAVSMKKAWLQLHLRYILDRTVPEYRAFAAGMIQTASPSERGLLCCLMFARTDRLFRELTLACVSPLLAKPGAEVMPSCLDDCLGLILEKHGGNWTEETRSQVRLHALSALKDFGLLTGSGRRHTTTIRPGPLATLFAARLSKLEGLSDRQALESQWFRILGLGPEQAASLLYEASRSGVLSFRMQADVVELSLPATEAG